METLDRLAASTTTEPALQRIRRLCLDHPDDKYAADILSFLATDAAVGILAVWAEESPQAAGLERLARAAWANPELLEALKPVRQVTRVETKYKRPELRAQYPAALSAAPDLIRAGSLANWLRRLICYLLLRSLDAVEDGVLRDEHIYKASLTAREAWQTYEHTRHEWLRPLVGDSEGLIEFEADTLIRCRQARRAAFERVRTSTQMTVEEAFHTDDTSPLGFYDAIIAILEHRDWRPMPLAAARTGEARPLTPYPAGPTGSLEPLRRLSEPTAGGSVNIGEPDGGGLTVTTQPTNKRHSQKRKERLGTKVRLEQVVESLYLPCHWSHLSPPEEDALRTRAEELLCTGPLVDRLGAALTLVAQVASSSMHDVEAIPLRLTKDHAWGLDLNAGHLIRAAPRFARRWSAESLAAEDLSWIRPLIQEWRYQLADRVLSVLREASQLAPGAASVAELWAGCRPGRLLERWFCQTFSQAPGLGRLGAQATANTVGLEVFRNTTDTTAARLVTSDHRTALPSSSTYGAFTGSETSAALGGLLRMPAANLIIPVVDSSVNAAGSELDIVESRVAEAIAGLIDRVEASAAGNDWVEHHNRLTALVIIALLSSSGARPSNSPFQSLTWFDLARALMFVEDKVTGPSKGSRLCVLSDVASSLLVELYVPHLRHLANGLRADAPEFAQEIERVLTADPEARLPLFFFLRNKPTLNWQEVAPTQLEEMSGLDWPLPANALRHWMSTRLRREGVHADIRDALLGHAERGAEPHGDFSARVPASDLERARDAVNRMQARIGLRKVPLSREPSVEGVRRPDSSLFDGRGSFGRQARQERRDAALASAQDLARREIEAYLNGRSIDQLTDQQVDELARKMLFRGTLPYSHASARYDVLEAYIQEQWAKHGRQTRLAKRYVIAHDGRALFNEYVLVAGPSLDRARGAFERAVESVPDGADGPTLMATLAAADMVLYSNLAYMPPLTALLTNDRKRFRLVRYEQRYWYEWGIGGEWHDGKPVMRIEISRRAFDWISALLISDRTLSSTPRIPRSLQAWCASVNAGTDNVGPILRQLVRWADQCNALALPGYQAAHLSGRRISAALPHSDWVRVVEGKAIVLKPELAEALERGSSDDESELARRFFRNHRVSTVNAADALAKCTKLNDDILAVLTQPDPKQPGAAAEEQPWSIQAASEPGPGGAGAIKGKPSRTSTTNSQKAYAIARLVESSGFGFGDAPWVLADFMVHVLTRKPMRGKADRLRGSTALRYWHSLARPFRDAVADRNFVGADEEDLTEWYSEIVEAWDSMSDKTDNAKGDPEPDSMPASDAPLRTLRQLLEFHDFFQNNYGGVDPDWSEVAPDITAPVGRPGLVGLAEYRAALRSLVQPGAIGSATTANLQAAFVMLVCFRFGLRISEAIGLARRDWIDSAGALTVIVRSNRLRPLKTKASRRVVPLLESLDELERSVIDHVINAWTVTDGIDDSRPLLAGLSSKNYKTTKARIGSTLLALLKATTLSQLTTVHHLRHSFAMRTLARALEVDLDCGAPPTSEQVEGLRGLLLGHTDIDRRLLWAVARLLGHSSPACTVQSYLNCIQLFMPRLVTATDPVGTQRTQRPGASIDLDAPERSINYLDGQGDGANDRAAVQRAPVTANALFIRSLQLIRLILIGHDETESAGRVGLDAADAKTLAAAFARVGARIGGPDSRYAGFRLLGSITPERMSQLLSHASAQGMSKLGGGRRVDDWLYTVGASRHVLLYEQEHFHAAADFLGALGLGADSAIVVRAVKQHCDLIAFAHRAGLDSLLADVKSVPIDADAKRFAKGFQLDAVRVGPRNLVVPDRMALIPRPGGIIRDTHELASLWLAWNLSAALAARRSSGGD